MFRNEHLLNDKNKKLFRNDRLLFNRCKKMFRNEHLLNDKNKKLFVLTSY